MEDSEFGYCENCFSDYEDDTEYCPCEEHDCEMEGCYGDNPNAHIEAFGTYAPGSDFDDYYNS